MNQLDKILADSAPSTAADVPRVRSAVLALSAAAEAAARAPGRSHGFGRRRVTQGVVAAALVLAGAGAAAAATSDWWGGRGEPELVIGAGTGVSDECLAGFRVTAGDDSGAPEAVAAARAALRDLRVADLDLAATERELANEGLLRDGEPAQERWHRVLSSAVRDQVAAELAVQGFETPSDWALLGHSECAEDPR